MMNLFLTGTDTGVGKTRVAALLVRALVAAGMPPAVMKPICAGDRDDAEALFAACEERIPLDTINPVWYRTPVAPYTAAIVENRPPDLALIREQWASLRARHENAIVEGVGGWLVPLAAGLSVADLASELALPVAVVVANRLGALNHTLLTVESIRQRGCPLAGYILNHPSQAHDVAEATNAAMLEELLGEPPLLVIEQGQSEISSTALARMMERLRVLSV